MEIMKGIKFISNSYLFLNCFYWLLWRNNFNILGAPYNKVTYLLLTYVSQIVKD